MFLFCHAGVRVLMTPRGDAPVQSVLTQARVARERVVVTGHIPPGVWSGCWVRVPVRRSCCVSTAFTCAAVLSAWVLTQAMPSNAPAPHGGVEQGNYSAAYEETLHEYRDVLAAQLFGHLHSGSFRLLRSPSVSTTPAYGALHTPFPPLNTRNCSVRRCARLWF